MMRTAVLTIASVAFCHAAFAADPTTILKALKAVPQEDLGKLARIEAHDGAPTPERWYILVHDSTSESGVKEHVVANGELVTSREISQFADKLSDMDVIGRAPLQVDSDKLAKLAEDYAKANDQTIATMSYQLGRASAETDPAWQVRCMDEAGTVLGTLVVTPQKGTVLSHEGFALVPSSKSGKTKSKKVKLTTQATPQVAKHDSPPPNLEEPQPETIADSSDDGRSTRRRSRSTEVRRAEPASSARSVTRPVRQFIRRVLPF